ncbi:MAG: MFS transporter [Conexivisphaera sp.]
MATGGGLSALAYERTARSFVIGYLMVALPLYLVELLHNALLVGILLTASGAVTLGIVVLVSAVGDVAGHARGLAAMELAAAVAAVGLLAVRSPAAILALVGLGGFNAAGFGATRDSMVPLVNALVRRIAGSDDVARTKAFGYLNLISTFGGVAGAASAAMVDPTIAFPLIAAISASGAVAVLAALGRGDSLTRANPFAGVRLGGRAVAGYSLSQLVAGVGVGLSMPLLSLWSHVYLGLGQGPIGYAVAAGNVAYAVASYYAYAVVRSMGLVRSNALSRLLSGVSVAALPLVRGPLELGALLAAYNALVGLGSSARSSFISGSASPGAIATSSAVGSVAMRSSITASTSLSGLLLDVDPAILMPLAGAALAASGIVYWWILERGAGNAYRMADARGEKWN